MSVISSERLRGTLKKHASLEEFTSWRTGGCADYLYLPADAEDMSEFLKTVPLSLPVTMLGLGSNTLIRDGGVEGVVIVTQGKLNKLATLPDSSLMVRAEAGISCAQLARYTARMGACGLEFLAGIPGTVGGALAMNAGCFGGETWKHVAMVETINRAGLIQKRFPQEFQVGYRHVERSPDEWFIAGHFSLTTGDKDHSLGAIRELLEKRNSSQPTGTANCGSVFRNPANDFAGRLIEQCGLKGHRIGGASVSEKHANFILNDDQATSADIEKLMTSVRAIVLEKTGVGLIPEICIIGRKLE